MRTAGPAIMKTDPDLMRELQEGSRLAFDKLFLRHQVGVYGFFARLSGDQELAEDLTQEVFLRLYLHAGTYTPSAKFTTYLYRIARNCWIDQLRRKKTRGTMDSLDRPLSGDMVLADRLAAEVESPEARLERADRAQAVREGLAGLPEEQRVVFVLSEVQGLKYQEIADILEIPVGTVKSRMHVAVNRLREFLTKRGVV